MDSPPQRPSGPPKPDADGNYDSPALRSLSRVWEDYCEEIAAPEDVMGVIAEIGNFSLHQLRTLEHQVEQGVSNPENEAFSLIFEAFETLVEACELMMMEFADEVPEDVEEPEDGFFTYGFDLVQEATNQMMEGHNLGMEHIEAMAEVNCPFCQHVNSRENPKCDKCGRNLPQCGGDSGSSLNVVEHQGLERKSGAEGEFTKNYVMTATILEDWKAGKVSAEQLTNFLDNLEQYLNGHLNETEQQEQLISGAPEGQQEALFQALELTRRGLHMSLEAVAKMRSAFDLQDDRYLFFGLSDLEEASKVMLEGYYANKKAAKAGG
jgi:hypothetical protein